MFAASQRRLPGPGAVRGGTLLGVMIGLVVGMTIAVVVAVFITRSPVPFVNKTGRTADRLVEPNSAAEAPDPNKPLYSKNRLATPPEGTPPAPAEERLSILERLFGRSSAEPEPAQPAQPDQPTQPAKPPEMKVEPRPPDTATAAPRPGTDVRGAEPTDRSSFLLQAGAFRSQEDANGMRGKLALLGFEARVLTAEVNGQTVYRVRIGPYAQLDELNKARARLAENGVEVSVVRQR